MFLSIRNPEWSHSKVRGANFRFWENRHERGENWRGAHNFCQFKITTILSMCNIIFRSLASKLTELAVSPILRLKISFKSLKNVHKIEKLRQCSWRFRRSINYSWEAFWAETIGHQSLMCNRAGSQLLFKMSISSLRWSIQVWWRFFGNLFLFD